MGAAQGVFVLFQLVVFSEVGNALATCNGFAVFPLVAEGDFLIRGNMTVLKCSPISIRMYLRLPLSSRFKFITAWAVVPLPAKKSRHNLSIFLN